MTHLEMRLTKESIEVIAHLAARLNSSASVYEWLTAKNQDLGHMSPLMLINRGRAFRVLELLRAGEKKCS